MTIDAHQHFWLYNPERDAWITEEMSVIRRDFLPADLEPVLAENGVDGCVAVQADQSEAETMFLLSMADAYPIVQGVVGWVDLRADNLYDKLEYFSQYELLKGFRHVAQAEADDFLARPEIIKGIRQLTAFDFTYDILIYPTQLKAALHLVRELPDVKFVVDHIAKPYIKDQKINTWSNYMAEIAKQPNVYCKVSGMVTEASWQGWTTNDFFPYLDVVFENFGPDRIMYGSDWPVCLVAGSYGQVKNIVEEYVAPWGTEVRDKVFGHNAVQFYTL
ncbi:amidohydrolase family protein [Arsenicibacter rosenii]|uniref:Amidohydrolase n=1 Tax=Arsenicibacter rosenii TaxID=1750698 RepID=A0A1S2VI80_9BACT|nr:amidohydrolase family protein [Arsenicibacter rosenii]OIN58461.1 amidohydrolase [Arsenicibacter rosenii]